jgi:hypothetical protein
MFASWLSSYERLSRALAGMVCKQYEWLRGQQQLGMKMWCAMMPATTRRGSTPARPSENTGKLEATALERLQKGLAPPREICDVQNRGRIDWTRVPEWAQPADPESFEGCGHEG